MSHQTPERNPFLLMVNPEVVLAAMEKSERLGQLNRHLCRPLDRYTVTTEGGKPAALVEDEEEEDDSNSESLAGAGPAA